MVEGVLKYKGRPCGHEEPPLCGGNEEQASPVMKTRWRENEDLLRRNKDRWRENEDRWRGIDWFGLLLLLATICQDSKL